MKKAILVSAVFAALSFSAVAADEHSRYVGAVDGIKDSLVIRDKAQFEDLIKYAKPAAQKALREAFADGKLTAAEIKASGIEDHHFYTGYLASSTTQAQYDSRLKELSGGQNVDNKFVSNRDLKAHGSMVMNQVEAGNKIQDKRVDKIVEGLKELGSHLTGPVNPSLPEGGQQIPNPPVEPAPPVETNKPYDDTAIKGDIANNSNSIQQMGSAFEQRVDAVNGYLSQAGAAITSNSGRIDTLENNFNALANQTAAEIARMDGRIDELEKKTDKLKAGVAGANAIGSLTQYTGNGTHHVAVGIGGYDGANAIAGGYTYAISAQTTIRATVAYDSEGDFGFGASVGHSW